MSSLVSGFSPESSAVPEVVNETEVSALVEEGVNSGKIPICKSDTLDANEQLQYGDSSSIRVGVIGTKDGDSVMVSVLEASETEKQRLKDIQNGIFFPNVRIFRTGDDAGKACVEYVSISGDGRIAVTSTRTRTYVYSAYVKRLLEVIS